MNATILEERIEACRGTLIEPDDDVIAAGAIVRGSDGRCFSYRFVCHAGVLVDQAGAAHTDLHVGMHMHCIARHGETQGEIIRLFCKRRPALRRW